MSVIEISAAAICAEKKATGNVYAWRALAKARAKIMKRRVGIPMKVYRCEICGHWHVASATGNYGSTRLKLIRRAEGDGA